MDEREQDLKTKISEARALLDKKGSPDELLAMADRMMLALEFRATDARIGLPSASDELIEEVRDLALSSLERAAENGHEQAAIRFAEAAYRERDISRGERAWALLSGVDSPRAAYLGGLYSFHGFGTERDHAASLKLHMSAADRGYADAMFEAYAMISQGLGCRVEADLAHTWLRRAAVANHPRALSQLGAMYATGRGLEEDPAKAIEYYDRAARAGHGRAAATLGVMYALGQGAPRSATRARDYFDLAEDNDFDWEPFAASMGVDVEGLGEDESTDGVTLPAPPKAGPMKVVSIPKLAVPRDLAGVRPTRPAVKTPAAKTPAAKKAAAKKPAAEKPAAKKPAAKKPAAKKPAAKKPAAKKPAAKKPAAKKPAAKKPTAKKPAAKKR